jgi:cell division protein FtsQ
MKRRWIAAGVVVAGFALWFGGPPLARRLDFFRVRRIEFVGLRYQSPDTVLRKLGLPASFSVFDPLEPLAVRATRQRGIRSARVTRRLPGTLVIRVTERVPVALVPVDGVLQLMDATGTVLPYDPARSAPDLPVAADATRPIGRLLAAVRQGDPGLFARVTAAAMRGADVVLTVDGRRMLLRPDASTEEMRAVTQVAADLTAKGQAFDELDGRFAGYVVVRGGA